MYLLINLLNPQYKWMFHNYLLVKIVLFDIRLSK
jgi:hypothetical protein